MAWGSIMRRHFPFVLSLSCAALLTSFAAPAFAGFQVTASHALPAAASRGQTVTLAASIESSLAADNMIVDLEIYNPTGAKVGQKYYQGQNFAAGRAMAYSWNYVVPEGAGLGAYTLKVGVFTPGWSSDVYWNNSAASFELASTPPVNGACGTASGVAASAAPTQNLCASGSASRLTGTGPWTWACAGSNGGAAASCSTIASQGAPAKFQVASASALPATVVLGHAVSLAANVQSSAAASNMIVDLEVYDPTGAKVGQTYFQGQNFSANHALPYAFSYTVPAAKSSGKYTLKVGVFGAGWSPNVYWNNSATTFAVSGAQAPVNGACGSSNGQTLASAPTGSLCAAGAASAVGGNGPWQWSCAGTNGGTAASCSASRAASGGSQGRVPNGLPSTFFIGLAAQPGSNQDWVKSSGVPWAVCYQYISSGVLPSQSWVTTWGTDFAYNYATASHSAGCIPEFTYYQMVPTIGAEGASAEQKALNNAAIMADYYKDFTALMQQLHRYGAAALVHVEPDMFGFLETLNGNPALLSASVASSGDPDVAGYPNTVAGFGQALLHLRDLYAPNVIMAAHVSTWLWDLSTDPSLNVAQIAKNDAAFMTGLGDWDLFFTDITDRDAAYYQFVKGDGGAHWWDATNQKYPNFNRLNAWADAFTTSAQKRLVIWQIPIGNTLMDTCNNTNFHYQDNREQYWLQNYPNNQAIGALAQSGVIGLLFGAGNSGTTQNYDAAGDGITNPAPLNGNTGVSNVSDDDGGLFRRNVGNYYGSGATQLP